MIISQKYTKINANKKENKVNRKDQIKALQRDWKENPRWANVKRPYSAEDVVRLRGSVQPECTYARRGAEKLWDLVNGSSKKGYVNCNISPSNIIVKKTNGNKI